MAGCSLRRWLPDACITCPSFFLIKDYTHHVGSRPCTTSLGNLEEHTFISSSVSNRKSSLKCVVVHDHLVPVHALPIGSIPSLKGLQHYSPSFFSSITSWGYDVVNPRASKRPVSADRETAHISRLPAQIHSFLSIWWTLLGSFINECILLVQPLPTISEMIVLWL